MSRISLSLEHAEKMYNAVQRIMHHWHPDPQDSDYQCEFCGEHAPTNQGEITHKPDCEGKEILNSLDNAIDFAEG